MSNNDERRSKEWWENYPPAPELELGCDYEFEDPEYWTENDRRRQAEIRRRWRDSSLAKEDRDKLPTPTIPPWDPIFSEGIIITFPIVPRKSPEMTRPANAEGEEMHAPAPFGIGSEGGLEEEGTD